MLLKAGAEVDKTTGKGETPLMLACDKKARKKGKVDTVLLLLQAGASANAADDDGRTPVDRGVLTALVIDALDNVLGLDIAKLNMNDETRQKLQEELQEASLSEFGRPVWG